MSAPPAGALSAGLCSVTFRDMDVAAVAAVAASAGLAVVEWGGDVHVPPGDVDGARHARRVTEDAGLAVCSYGSYLSCDAHGVATVGAVLDTAEILGTTVVRVWAPWGVTPDAPADRRVEVSEHVASVAGAADARGITVYLEFHSDTLTASAISAATLLAEVDAPNLACGWQPPYWAPQSEAADVADLALLAPHLGHLHAFAWSPDGTRHPLSVEEDRWQVRLAAAAAVPLGPLPDERAVLIEFVAGDDPANLAADAAALSAWIGAAA